MTRSVFSPAYQRVREWLIDARTTGGVTQVELAARLGRGQSFVSKYERGERRLDIVELLEIADLLHADACELINELRRPSAAR